MEEKSKVLVVGDEDVFSELLGRLPTSHFALAYAADLVEALAQLEQHRPNLVVIVAAQDGGQLRELLSAAHHGFNAMSLAVASEKFEATLQPLCDYVVNGDDMDQVAATTASIFTPPPDALDLERPQLAALSERIDGLERRVVEVALGTTGGLSELLEATDGLAQGLKLHARMLKDLEQRLGPASPTDARAASTEEQAGDEEGQPALTEPADGPQTTAAEETNLREEMERRLTKVAKRLESLEGRVGEVALGTTGGLSELLAATDGLGQGLKEQARALGELEQRLGEVGERHSQWQKELEAARAAQAEAQQQPAADEALERRLALLAERLESLEGRVAEVALGATGGLSELLAATDGLGQGLKEQARVLGDLDRRLREVGVRQKQLAQRLELLALQQEDDEE
jgi:CheY-like chemotaxis protein